MKPSHTVIRWFAVVACLVLSFVGLFYAYYYSWLLSTPGVPIEMQRRYDWLSRVIGMPSMALFLAALIGGVWILFSKSKK